MSTWQRRAVIFGLFSVLLPSVPGPFALAAGKPSVPVLSLPTAQHARCVKPRSTPQIVTLPATGGITATFTVGPFPKGSTQCLPMAIGTGDDIVSLPVSIAAPSIAQVYSAIAASGTAAGEVSPLLTVTVGAGTDATPMIPFGGPVVVTGTKLTAASSLNLPDGTYFASVRRTDGTQSVLYPNLEFIAKGGVLRLAPIVVTDTGPDGKQQTTKKFPVLRFVDASFTISLYPLGVNPPVPLDAPTTTTPSTSPDNTKPRTSTTLPPVPPHAAPMKGALGFPPPDWGSVIGSLTWEWANCRGSDLCTWTANVISGGGGDTALNIPANFEGTATFSLNIAYMVLRSITYENCPRDWSVFADFAGAGVVTVAGTPPNLVPGGVCKIRMSTIPKGKNGTGFEMVLAVRGIDTGERPR